MSRRSMQSPVSSPRRHLVEKKILQGHEDSVETVRFSHDNTRLASGSTDGSVKLWNVKKGTVLKTIDPGGTVYAVRWWGKSNSKLIIASGDASVSIWTIDDDPKVLHKFTGHAMRVWSVCCVLRDNIASASHDRTVRIWDSLKGDGDNMTILSGHTDAVVSVDAQIRDQRDPRETMLASGSWDGTVRLWCARSHKCIAILEGHLDKVVNVGFSGNGEVLASGSVDHMVRIWAVNSRSCIRVLSGHVGNITSVSFSPAGDILATGSQDNTVRLWHSYNGECVDTLLGHEGPVFTICWTNCGGPKGILATGSDDHNIRLWRVHSLSTAPFLVKNYSTFLPEVKWRIMTIMLVAERINNLARCCTSTSTIPGLPKEIWLYILETHTRPCDFAMTPSSMRWNGTGGYELRNNMVITEQRLHDAEAQLVRKDATIAQLRLEISKLRKKLQKDID